MIKENININIHKHTSHDVWVILFFSLPKIEIVVGYLLQLELCLAGTHDPLWEHLGMLAWCLITQTGNQQFSGGLQVCWNRGTNASSSPHAQLVKTIERFLQLL